MLKNKGKLNSKYYKVLKYVDEYINIRFKNLLLKWIFKKFKKIKNNAKVIKN